jgi:hypothetical protein
MATKTHTLQFGIMTHGMVLSSWQYECIKLLNESGIAKVVLIINDASVNSSKPSISSKFGNYFNKHALYKLSSRFLFKVPSFEHITVTDVLKKIDVLNCTTTKKGKFSEYFAADDIEQIKSRKLDFILRFGFNIIRGDILEVAKYGVWSFHHGNELEFRGGPAGFWEIFRNSKINGVILQKLNNLIDAGVIINRRSYQTVLHSYSEHLNKLLAQSTDMPLQVCNQIISGDESSFQKEHSTSNAPMNRLPNNWTMIKFHFLLFRNRIMFHIARLFKQEHWDIGIVKNSDEQLPISADFKNVNWFNLRRGSKYAADSFCFESNNSNYIVFEDYDYKTKKGIISLAKLNEDNMPIEVKPVLEKSFHLAYPFVFKHNQNIYLIPETAENDTVELYKWDTENEKFDFQQILINIPGVDTSIVLYKGRWWIFCGLKDDLPNEKLHIYYSDELTGEYKAHKLNPVKVDPAGSRPGGQFIIKNDVLYRPAQHSVAWYGEKIDWFKVVNLTPTSFNEEFIGDVKPHNMWEHNEGLHTFSQTSKIMVIDAKKRSSSWHAFLSSLGNK